VKATTHYQDAAIIVEVSKNLGEAMPGLDIKQIPRTNCWQRGAGKTED